VDSILWNHDVPAFCMPSMRKETSGGVGGGGVEVGGDRRAFFLGGAEAEAENEVRRESKELMGRRGGEG